MSQQGSTLDANRGPSGDRELPASLQPVPAPQQTGPPKPGPLCGGLSASIFHSSRPTASLRERWTIPPKQPIHTNQSLGLTLHLAQKCVYRQHKELYSQIIRYGAKFFHLRGAYWDFTVNPKRFRFPGLRFSRLALLHEACCMRKLLKLRPAPTR